VIAGLPLDGSFHQSLPSSGHPGRARRACEPADSLWSRLTERERRILNLAARHRVLTTDQLQAVEFGSATGAQHRLQELTRLDSCGGSGSLHRRVIPWWYYAVGYTGARLVAAQNRRLSDHRARLSTRYGWSD
jgi:hypothetical protein